jgi:hypothetical protein
MTLPISSSTGSASRRSAPSGEPSTSTTPGTAGRFLARPPEPGRRRQLLALIEDGNKEAEHDLWNEFGVRPGCGD